MYQAIKEGNPLDVISGAEADTNPCSLTPFMKSFLADSDHTNRAFMEELRLGRVSPVAGIHVGKSTQVYSDLKRGAREIAWFPSRVSIPLHVEPFLLGRGLDGIITLIEDDSRVNRTIADQVDMAINRPSEHQSWVISWIIPGEKSSGGSNQSGFHQRTEKPTAVELTLMIARAIFRQQGVPFASKDQTDLIFVPTSTPIGLGYEIAVAYVPGKAIYYHAFAPNSHNHTIMSSDLVLVTIPQ